MFGIAGDRKKLTAIVDVGSASAGVAILSADEKPQIVSLQRENLPLEERSEKAQMTGVLKCLATALERAQTEIAAGAWKGKSVYTVYAIVGAPWSRSFSARSSTTFTHDTLITDALIKDFAQKALADHKDIDASALLEASVVRIKLNEYSVAKPVGKHCKQAEVFVLASDCKAEMKSSIEETLARVLPGASVAWRSSARAALTIVRQLQESDTCLIVDMSPEATDLIVVRKGVLTDRNTITEGALSILSAFGGQKPPEETLALLDMLTHEQCEGAACDALRAAIAKAEPELVRTFGEALAKLASNRRLPNALILLAPAHLYPWLSGFFSRIDFTQFTTTTQPFVVSGFGEAVTSLLSETDDKRVYDDPGLSIGAALVNIESHS